MQHPLRGINVTAQLYVFFSSFLCALNSHGWRGKCKYRLVMCAGRSTACGLAPVNLGLPECCIHGQQQGNSGQKPADVDVYLITALLCLLLPNSVSPEVSQKNKTDRCAVRKMKEEAQRQKKKKHILFCR